MTDELKPCPNPWCGSPRPPFLVWELHRRHVQCVCGVRGPSSDHHLFKGVRYDVLEAEAIAAWNTRADLATPLDDPRVKALVDAAREVKADCIARADKNGVVPIGRGAWDQLTAALSALGGRT